MTATNEHLSIFISNFVNRCQLFDIICILCTIMLITKYKHIIVADQVNGV